MGPLYSTEQYNTEKTIEMLKLFQKESIPDYRIPHNQDEIKKRIKVVVIDDDEARSSTQLLSSSGYTTAWWEKVNQRKKENK